MIGRNHRASYQLISQLSIRHRNKKTVTLNRQNCATPLVSARPTNTAHLHIETVSFSKKAEFSRICRTTLPRSRFHPSRPRNPRPPHAKPDVIKPRQSSRPPSSSSLLLTLFSRPKKNHVPSTYILVSASSNRHLPHYQKRRLLLPSSIKRRTNEAADCSFNTSRNSIHSTSRLTTITYPSTNTSPKAAHHASHRTLSLQSSNLLGRRGGSPHHRLRPLRRLPAPERLDVLYVATPSLLIMPPYSRMTPPLPRIKSPIDQNHSSRRRRPQRQAHHQRPHQEMVRQRLFWQRRPPNLLLRVRFPHCA